MDALPERTHLAFWGKAQPVPGSVSPYHPIAYHCLDVAAVALRTLSVRPSARGRTARLLGADERQAMSLVGVLAGLHDLGKFGSAFQAKCPLLVPAALAPFEVGRVPASPHTLDGLTLWEDVLKEDLSALLCSDGGLAAFAPLMPGVFGHHGSPAITRSTFASSLFRPAAIAAARSCARDCVQILLQSPLDGLAPLDRTMRRASWWISGLLSLSDWIGSNQRWFPYHAADLSPGQYWDVAWERAERAVREAGLAPPTVAPARSFQQLTGKQSPTPLQEWAAAVDLAPGQLLFIVEDLTGAGKTEAAQILVNRLMASGRASGAYWAMPTQATANAMYKRQAAAVSQLFDADGSSRPSLILAHARSALHSGFTASVLGSASREHSTGEVPSDDADDVPSSAWCSAFLADDRRAAFLADVGVGTIDQALLGALPSRFNTIRLTGLAEKVLVVDEAHAYDAFTSEELRQLLRFQATLGGHAIVLSATLDGRRREQLRGDWLVDAPRQRRPLFVASAEVGASSMGSGPEDQSLVPYPLATVVSSDGVGSVRQAVAVANWSARRLPVRLIHDPETALEHVEQMSRCGAAVAWVRNTVPSCVETARTLRARGIACEAFHARFAQCDRQHREAEVMERFGPAATASARAGRVLIATQVIEQSLDLDFDVMISDLAPIDLLIQRAGRLWRHRDRAPQRPHGVSEELVVLSPVPDDEVAASWVASTLPGTQHVYKREDVLWRTARVVATERGFEVPRRSRHLIEAVYGSDDCPDALRGAADRAHGADHAGAGVARSLVLNADDGYHGDGVRWSSDLRTPTRLGEEQTTIRLAMRSPDGGLRPWSADGDTEWKRWTLSEVRTYATQVPWDTKAIERDREAVSRLRSTWSRFEQGVVVAVLDEKHASGIWNCLLQTTRGVVQLTYSAQEGLTVIRETR